MSSTDNPDQTASGTPPSEVERETSDVHDIITESGTQIHHEGATHTEIEWPEPQADPEEEPQHDPEEGGNTVA